MLQNNYKTFWLFNLFLLAASSLAGQLEAISIADVTVKEGANQVELFIKAVDAQGNPVAGDLLKGQLNIQEYIDGVKEPLIKMYSDDPITDTVFYKKITSASDTFIIDILVDISQNMSVEDLKKVSEILQELPQRFPLTAPSKYRLTTFSHALHEKNKILETKDFAQLSDILLPTKQNCFLYESIDWVFKNWRSDEGKKIMLLFSSGIDDTPESAWQWRTKTDINTYLDSTGLDNNWFFPIGIGENTAAEVFASFTAKTLQTDDAFYAGVYPTSLDSLTSERQQLKYTHKIAYRPEKGIFSGEERHYEVIYKTTLHSPILTRRFGSLSSPLMLQTIATSTWFIQMLIGFFILIISVFLSGLILPILRQKQFVKKYVSPYLSASGRRQLDPFTNLPIEEGELVVNRCPQVTTWESWKDFGHQCPNYPDCIRSMTHFNCQGEGAPEKEQNFMAMSGVNRYLHWGLFGMAGGLIAWIVFAMVKAFAFGTYRGFVQQLSIHKTSINIDSLANQTLIGIAFGLGLTLMLAIVEELGQSRNFSIGRVLVRSIIGICLTTFLFVGTFFAQYHQVFPNNFVTDSLAWVLAGSLIGMVLSVNSTIRFSRGLLGGLLAGAVAFGSYLLIAILFNDFNLAKLISLIIMGCLLGIILVSVVMAAEDAEIEYLAPVKYHRTVPISKWLKQGVQIDIGTAQGAYIPIKWPDPEAANRHALLIQDKGQIYLHALAETLVNGKIINENQNVLLTDGAIIQLGRRGLSKFRFRSKKKELTTPSTRATSKSKAAFVIKKIKAL